MNKVSKEKYMAYINSHDLKPIASFSDPDGTCPFGFGCPAMDTYWGMDGGDETLAKCEMRKESRHDKEWEYTFYLRDNQ